MRSRLVHLFDGLRVGTRIRMAPCAVIYSRPVRARCRAVGAVSGRRSIHGIAFGPVLGMVAITLAACTSVQIETAPSPSMFTASATTTSPSPEPSPIRTSPLTGRPEPEPRPVLIVKLDNTRNAQPHAGLAQADIVFVEEVEWGLNRIAAVFSSTIPDRIGPIRSARISDIDLVAQFGEPAVAFSGAQHKLWPALEAASFIDVSANKGGAGYSRDGKRRAPYNYFGNGPTLLERAKGEASASRDIGYVFAEQPPAGGRPAQAVKAAWPYAKMRFAYDAADGTYTVGMDGKEALAEETGEVQRASTVIVQYVEQRDSGFGDRGGGHTPLLTTTGSGTGVVLRDGQAWDVRWSRPDETSGTTWTLADGTPMPFKPGQQWVVLMNARTPVTVLPEPGAGGAASGAPSSPASGSGTARPTTTAGPSASARPTPGAGTSSPTASG